MIWYGGSAVTVSASMATVMIFMCKMVLMRV